MRLDRFLVASLTAGVSLVVMAAPAAAATVSGAITDSSGTGLANMEVRLWEQTDKGYKIAYTQDSAVGGGYSFSNVAEGTYKLDARMAPGVGGNYGDTWYDQAPPSSNGVFAADADVLTIAQGDTLTGMDIALPLTGGFDGHIVNGSGTKLPDIAVRAESRADYRYNHVDLTDDASCCGGERLGSFSMRGLISTANGHDYRILAYDYQGRYEMLVDNGPYDVTDATAPDIGTFTLQPMASDPLEPNNSPSAGTAIGSLPYTSSGATIAPRGSDVDWYCLSVQDGDRLLARVDTTVTIEGTNRPNPWLDPILSFWPADGSQVIKQNDDDPNAQTLESALDTGLLSAGDYCFAVSTYGDSDWTGAQQITTGHYDFSVQMGNRAPSLSVTYQQNPVPQAPQTISTDEGTALSFDLSYSDPDGDALTPQVTATDSAGQTVQGTLTPTSGGATYTWTPSQTAANGSPYQLSFEVSDGEFTKTVTTNVEVSAVNLPPSTPVLDSPVGGEHVGVTAVPLTVQNSTDPDDDPLTYDFEMHVGAPDSQPEQTGSAPEDSSGTTSWTTADLDENATISWRARAFDGNAQNGYSPWSDWETFMVDTVNEAPSVPKILKPTAGQDLVVTKPRISASAPTDPENDAVSVTFAIADDVYFQNVLASSTPVPVTSASTTVEWTTDPALHDGGRYFVRARAIDERGAESAWSDPVTFIIESIDPPKAPMFQGDLSAQCSTGYVFDTAPSSLTVDNYDHTGDTVSFQLQIFPFGSSPESNLLYDKTVPQALGDQTEIPVDPSIFEENGHYWLRIRTIHGERQTDWVECQIFLNAVDDPADTLQITAPDDGQSFDAGNPVEVKMTNPYDPDPLVSQLTLGVCVSTKKDYADCPADLSQWPTVDYDGPGESSYTIDDLSTGGTRYVRACAIDSDGNCVQEDTVSFDVSGPGSTSGQQKVAEAGCGCNATADASASWLVLLGGVLLLGWRRRRAE